MLIFNRICFMLGTVLSLCASFQANSEEQPLLETKCLNILSNYQKVISVNNDFPLAIDKNSAETLEEQIKGIDADDAREYLINTRITGLGSSDGMLQCRSRELDNLYFDLEGLSDTPQTMEKYIHVSRYDEAAASLLAAVGSSNLDWARGVLAPLYREAAGAAERLSKGPGPYLGFASKSLSKDVRVTVKVGPRGPGMLIEHLPVKNYLSVWREM